MSFANATLVIFDLDGTLVDTLPATFECFQKAVGDVLGKPPTREEILERFGPADHEIISTWVGPDHAAEAVKVLYACYETAFKKAGPFAGIHELLQELRARRKQTALFTGRGRHSTDIVLRSMGLDALLDFTVTGEEVPDPKPAPDGILKVLEVLNKEPEETVYVGDTVKDVQAAIRSGVTPVVALWGTPEPEKVLQEKAVLAKTVAELSELLLPR